MFWLNVNKISLGKIKKKNTSADTAIRHFKNDKRTGVTGAEMLFGIFFPLPLVIVPEVFAKVNWSPLSEDISFPALFIDHFER